MPANDAESDTSGESDAAMPDLSARAESENCARSVEPCTNSPAYDAESVGAGESDAAMPDL